MSLSVQTHPRTGSIASPRVAAPNSTKLAPLHFSMTSPRASASATSLSQGLLSNRSTKTKDEVLVSELSSDKSSLPSDKTTKTKDELLVSEIRYTHPPQAGEGLWIKVSEEDFGEWKMTLRWHDVPVPFLDARPFAGKTSIDREGFEIHHLASAVTDWDDEEEVRSTYYSEAVDLVKRATGARHASVFDHTFRRARGAAGGAVQPGRPKARDPVQGVHVDYSPASAEKRIEDFYGKTVREKAGRFGIVNLWLPLVEEVYDLPLAFIDATSLASGDLSVYNLIYPNRVGQNQTVHHNPGHRWYYLPRQRSQEAYLFKQFDSDETKTRWVPHSAFKDPSAPEEGTFRPRESIELRIFVFYDADEEQLAALKAAADCNQ